MIQEVCHLLVAFWISDLLIIVERKNQARTVCRDLVDES